tara:strand:- start:32365 stop:33045 length:681 start_codon:yes stop_codon:yes gene_type:complete
MSFENKEQFLIHTKKHIENVNILAEELIQNVFESSLMSKKGIKPSEELKNSILRTIKLHDRAKTEDSPDFLDIHNLEKPFYEVLYECAGKELTGENRDIIKRLNDLDKLVTTIALTKEGLNQNERELYFFIEATTDIVERGCNPITPIELGRETLKAHSFIKKLPKTISDNILKTEVDNEVMSLIQNLESFYDENILFKQIQFKNDLFKNTNKNINTFKTPRFKIK